MISLPFSEDKLEIDQMMDYRGFWIRMISKFMLFSKIISKRK